jgi:putative transposase
MSDYQGHPHLSVVLSQQAIQELLLGKMKNAALSLVASLFEQDVERICGKKFAHKGPSHGHRGGSEQTSVVVAGAKHSINRPRVRKDGQEIALPSYLSLHSQDILDERMMTHMVEGISTRSYNRVIEDYADRFGVSKSSVSRAFVRGSKDDLDAINSQDLSDLRFLALMIDGIEFAGRTVVVALGVTDDGQKIVLGLRDGATENSEVCTDLLSGIGERGFTKASKNLLVVLDGGKALGSVVRKVFGEHAVVQRCYLHKLRNLEGYLTEEDHPELRRRMKVIMTANSFEQAVTEHNRLQEWLDEKNFEAASSLREIGMDLLGLHRLGITGLLRRSLASTNLIESLFSVVRHKCARVKNWNSSTDARLRWVASAARAHQSRMRRIQGCKEIEKLKIALNGVVEFKKIG